MNYRPYPNVDRALAQVERRHALQPPQTLLGYLDKIVAPLKLADWQREWASAWASVTLPKQAGRSGITAAIVDQAVKAGEHVHVAGRDGVRCLGSDGTCTTARGPHPDLQLTDEAEVSGE